MKNVITTVKNSVDQIYKWSYRAENVMTYKVVIQNKAQRHNENVKYEREVKLQNMIGLTNV